VRNVSERAGIRTALAEMGGRFFSDSPVELAIVLGAGPLGMAIKTLASVGMKGKSAVKTFKAVDKLQAISSRGGRFSLTARNAARDSLEGLVAGFLSESIIQGIEGRDDPGQVLQVALSDALISPVFGFILRAGLKIGGKTLGAFKRDLAEEVAEVTGVPRTDLEPVVDQLVEAHRIPELPEGQRNPIVNVRQNLDDDGVVAAFSGVNASSKADDIADAFRNIADDSSQVNVDSLVRSLEGRAKARKESLGEFVQRNVTDAEGPTGLRRLVDEYNELLDAPNRAATPGGVFARVASIMMRDLSDTHARVLRSVMGIDEFAGVPPQAAERLGKIIDQSRIDPRFTANRELRRALKAANQWAEDVYGGIFSGRLVPEDIVNRLVGISRNSLFAKEQRLLPEGQPFDPFAAAERASMVGETPIVRRAGPAGGATPGGPDVPGGAGAGIPGGPAVPGGAGAGVPAVIGGAGAGIPGGPAVPGGTGAGVPGGPDVPGGTGGIDGGPGGAGRAGEPVPRAQDQPFLSRDEAAKAKGEVDTTRLANDILEARETVGQGIFANSRIFKFFNNKVTPFIGTFNFTLQTLLENLGSTFSRQFDSFKRALNVEEGFNFRLDRAAKATADEVGFTRDDIISLKNKKTVDIEGKQLELNGIEALNLHMYARDAGGTHPAAKSLAAKGYEMENGSRVRFNKEQVDLMADETWLANNFGDEVLRAKRTARAYLDEGKVILNEESVKQTGFEAIGNENPEYYMKRVIGDANSPEELAAEILAGVNKALDRGQTQVIQSLFDTTALNRLRRGEAVLKFQNPLEASLRYSQQLSRMAALGEDLAKLAILTKALKGDIDSLAGTNITRAIDKIIARTAGKLDPTGDPITGKLRSRLFKGQVLSALAFNLTTPFKQLGSFAAAMAKLAPSIRTGNPLRHFAGSSPIAARDPLHAEMLQTVPLYANRWGRRGPGPDIDDMQLSDAFSQAVFGEMSIRDAAKNAGLIGGLLNLVEKGMRGIKEADGFTLRGIYRAVREEIGTLNPELKGDDFLATVNRRFNDIVNETQPTTHPLTRTANQNSQEFFTRSFTLFSSQPVKNFNLMLNNVARWAVNPTPENKRQAMLMLKMMALQSAYITAIGAGIAGVREELLGVVRSRKAQRQREKFRRKNRTVVGDIGFRALRDVFGNVPVTGQLSADAMSALFGGPSFGIQLPGVDSANDFIKFLAAEEKMTPREARRIMRAMAPILGIPREGLRFVEEGVIRE